MRRILWLALAALIVWLVHDRADLERLASLDGLRALLAGYGSAAPFVFFGVCVAAVLLHLPELLFVAAGGILFGAIEGTVIAWSATVVGASLTFLVSRYLLRDIVQRYVSGRFARLHDADRRLAERGLRTVFLLRLAIPFSSPLNWVLGPTCIRFRDYVAGTALGIVPGAILVVFFGERLARVGSAAELLEPANLAPALALLALPIVGALLARWMLTRSRLT